MSSVSLQLRTMNGKNHTLSVPQSISIEDLETTVAKKLGFPVSRLVHSGRQLEKGHLLSNYRSLNYKIPFYVVPWLSSGYQPSILQISNANRTRRAARLEAHLRNKYGFTPSGAPMRKRSNAQRTLQNMTGKRTLPNNITRSILKYIGGKTRRRR